MELIAAIETLKALKKQNPEAMKPLVAAFRASDGDVDTLAKLYKWTEDQVTPWGAVRSPNPKEMNFFAKGLWNYHMNNTLSAKAPINAAIGNLYQITIKPLTSMLGHVPYALFDRNIDGLDILPTIGANVYDILKRDTLVLTKAGVVALEARLK